MKLEHIDESPKFEPDALAGRHSREPDPHPYRKYGKKPGDGDSNNPNSRGPIDRDAWMKSSKKMEEEGNLKPTVPQPQKPSNPAYPQGKFNKDEWMRTSKKMEEDQELNEISDELLKKYKTAAALDLGAADDEGDVKRGSKRIDGIVKATKKQFANNKKREQTPEGSMGGINRSAPAVDVSYEKVLEPNPRTAHSKVVGEDGVLEQVMNAYESEGDRPIGYLLTDKDGTILGKYGPAQRSRASSRRDKLDNEHGAYRYRVTPVYAGSPEARHFPQPAMENKHRKKDASNFTDILNKQHQDQSVQPAKQAIKDIPFHGWTIRYRPAAKPGDKVQWMVINKKGETKSKGEAESGQEAVRAGEEFVKQGAGEKKTANSNVTIDFNSKFVQQFAPGAETFFSTIVSQNGQPYLVFSDQHHDGLQKSSIRAGTNFPSITLSPRISNATQLQPHGRYIIDVDNKEALDEPGTTMYPLVFQGITQDKTDRAHLAGPGLTVAVSRGIDEQIDRWKSWAPIDPTTGEPSTKIANMQKRAPKNAKMGTEEIPFSDLVCDTIRKHGIRWAFDYYVIQGGVPTGEFKILARDALNNP